jgi:beta-galactosidase
MAISEYGAGGAFTQHTDNPEGGIIASRGRPHPEEVQSWFHERNWSQLRDRRYLFATWIWNMFDFSSNLRAEGEAIDLNDKGLVSFDRRTRKDAFYFYQANWSQSPVLHITGRRYVDRAYPVLDVRAYSNAESATLTVNGVKVGETRCPDRICVWRNVRLVTGENVVRAQAQMGRQRLSDEVRWIAPDANEGLRIDSGELVGHDGTLGRFGSDNFFVGGTPMPLNSPSSPGVAPPPRKVVEGEGDLSVFNAYRQGDFTYHLPLPDGAWRVRLLTFEPDASAAATRTFNVTANGQSVLTNFNPAREGGGVLRAVERTFSATATDSRGVDLAFQSVGGPAIVAAILVSR